MIIKTSVVKVKIYIGDLFEDVYSRFLLCVLIGGVMTKFTSFLTLISSKKFLIVECKGNSCLS